MSYWDILPEEILDRIVLFTDLDTAILLKRTYCVGKFLQIKRNAKLLNWAIAAKEGNIQRMQYMLNNGVSFTHDSRLIDFALTSGHLDCAKWIYNRRDAIKRLLWKKKHQRKVNHFVTEWTLPVLIMTGRHEEALWFLNATNYRFHMYTLFATTGLFDSDPLVIQHVLQEASRIRDNDQLGLPYQLLIRIAIVNALRDGTYRDMVHEVKSWNTYHCYNMNDSVRQRCYNMMWNMNDAVRLLRADPLRDNKKRYVSTCSSIVTLV